jgi:hypothetical protein
MRCTPFQLAVFLVNRAWINLVTIFAGMRMVRIPVQLRRPAELVFEIYNGAIKIYKEYRPAKL